MKISDSALPNQLPVSSGEMRSIVIGLMLIILLGALDQTIVSVSLPQIVGDLGGTSLLAWVVSAYLVASTVSTPVYGKLGDLYGRRLLLSVAVTIFLLASMLCAVAPTMPVLIAGRVLQGIGGGGLISVAQAIIGEVVPLRERGRYQGYVSVTYAVASIGGPVLGGFLTHLLSWRWVFWINLPIGIAALWIARRALKSLPVPGLKRPVDYPGILLLASGLSLLLVGVTDIGHGGSYGESRSWAGQNGLGSFWLIVAAAALIAVFVRHEHRCEEPVIPPTLFRLRPVWISCMVLFANFFQIVGLSMLIPYGMQMLDGISPSQAALHLIALSLAIPAGAFLSGRYMGRTGRYKPMQLIGTGLLPLAMVWLAYLGPHATLFCSMALALAGLSTGMTLPACLVAAQNAVEAKDIGVATAVTALFRSLGGAIGVTVLSSVVFALMDPGTSAVSIEAGLKEITSNAGSAGFAFRSAFICGAVVALAAHGLAWLIPENTLRSAGKTASSE